MKEPRFIDRDAPLSRGLWRSLLDFLAERPVKISRNAPGDLRGDTFGKVSFLDNLKDFFRPLPASLRGSANSRMIVEQRPLYRIFWENLRDTISPPKLPPLKVTSKPVQVKDIWSKDEYDIWAKIASLVLQVAVLFLLVAGSLFFIGSPDKLKTPKSPIYDVVVDISPYLPKLAPGGDKAGGGGGGGERMNVPPSKGRLPKFDLQPLTPPMATIRNQNPKLAADPAVLVPPDIRVPQPNINAYGDPLAAMVTGSGGPGGGGGIGTGCCGGVGSGSGPGVGPGSGGGIGGGPFRPGKGGVGFPECAYCPDPRFSDEARKSKYQGVVTLRVIVQTDGRATNISVVRGLGMGLDENAKEAVKGWRFKPAIGPGGKPVPVEVLIEVTFRLL
ncbi:MAG: energy transducer TonB [Candidatus Liptonbacteria bacterium]|nr:energy transducer TonB [Candidatus Liptonbacteria bacterium]